MQRKLILTSDGSHTISIPELNVTYHSIHGAIQESKHVFIEAGLDNVISLTDTWQITILEVGFGTGLNALLTAIEVEKTEKSIYYAALEPFPLDREQIHSLNYCELLGRKDLQPLFEQLHTCEWEKKIDIAKNFSFKKSKTDILNLETSETFQLIFFDAFAPSVQPELWTKEIFEKMFEFLGPRGVLVTYCSKGDVRRAMQAAGFVVEKLPGPKGKREMIRAHPKVI